eukprot:UN3671
MARERVESHIARVKENKTMIDDSQARLRALPRAIRNSTEGRQFQQQVYQHVDISNQQEAELDTFLANLTDSLQGALAQHAASEEGKQCIADFRRRLDQIRPFRANHLSHEQGFGKGPRRSARKRLGPSA